jgi:phosphatidyl-myo-inositol dimannoside synthase
MMKKRNVLLVAGVFPPGVGGMQNYYYNLCRHSGHKITVFASDYKGAPAFDAGQAFRVIRKPFLRDEKVSVWHTLRMIPQVGRVIKEENIDITVYGYILYGLIGWFQNVFRGRKYGVSVHGMDVLKLTRYAVLRSMVKAILQRADAVIVNSAYVKRLMMELGVKEERLQVVYPGVEEQYDRMEKDPALIRKHSLEGKYVLMTLGRLVGRKGFDMVIRAMPEVRKAIPDAVYLIVGGGPEREALERLAKETGVSDCVVFAGRAADEDLVKYYNLCDVFVMPSRYIAAEGDVEGFGIVYMEASSCGKPVIGGNSGGVVEAVLDGETGLIVDPSSAEAIAQAVIRLRENPALAERLAETGYKRAKEQFRYGAITRDFDAFLGEQCGDAQEKALQSRTRML